MIYLASDNPHPIPPRHEAEWIQYDEQAAEADSILMSIGQRVGYVVLGIYLCLVSEIVILTVKEILR